MSRSYERVVIDEIAYFVCVNCRLPHFPGTDAPYTFPEPGGTPEARRHGQSLCGKCYRAAYAFMYPPRIYPNQPDVPDNALDVEPIPWDTTALERLMGPRTEQQVWAEAFARWQRDPSKAPEQVFAELWELEGGSAARKTDLTEVQLEIARR